MIDNLIKEATCRVQCDGTSGTGFLVSDRYILTALHCVTEAIESQKKITVSFPRDDQKHDIPATVVAHAEEIDACILSISEATNCKIIPLSSTYPREGSEWKSFGYSVSRMGLSHRLSGTVSQVLETPKLKVDLDLLVDPEFDLNSYSGFSGAALVSENTIKGLIRLKMDGTLCAISTKSLQTFLENNDIKISEGPSNESKPSGFHYHLADRSEFQENLEHSICKTGGEYIFLEGAHGIGKTTFCNEFMPKDEIIVNLGAYSLVPQSGSQGAIYRSQPEIFFDWLSTTVSSLITGGASRRQEHQYAALIIETSELLNAFADYCAETNRHGLFFLDGLNEAQSVDPNALAKLVGLLPPILPPNITMVLTAPNYQSLASYLSGRVKGNNIISLPQLTEKATKDYCWSELEESLATPSLIARITEKAKGHPLYLRYLIEFTNSDHGGEHLDDFPTFTGTIEQYYETLWSKLLLDAEAINFLAIMARLRWGIEVDNFLKILTLAEKAVFIPTISRIRHLLLDQGTTTIYHPSFTDFLITKTAYIEVDVQQRLAKFCITEACTQYCSLNVVFHLLRSNDEDKSKATTSCNQDWVDKCVTLGVDPDILLLDIEETIAVVSTNGSVIEAIRLQLLYQRVNFRYNTLFAQSARLIAEALIALNKPEDALMHAVRYNNLIVNPDEAFQIALRFIQYGFPSEALKLLDLLHLRILESYTQKQLRIEEFVHICSLHLETTFFMRLAKDDGRMPEIFSVLQNAREVLESSLAETDPDLVEQLYAQVQSVGTSFFLCFHDTYLSIAKAKEMRPDLEDYSGQLSIVIWALLQFERLSESYNMPKNVNSLSQVFSDLDEQYLKGHSSNHQDFIPALINTLILLHSPSSTVQLVANSGEQQQASPFNIVKDNGVDVDYESIHRGAAEWRAISYLKNEFACPSVSKFDETNWLHSLNQLMQALYWCDGKARLATVDKNESLLTKVLSALKVAVLEPLSLSLQQRTKWLESYAIPEQVFPLLYEKIIILLMDCYPEELSSFLEDLLTRTSEQCGLYNEGFRSVMLVVLQRLINSKIAPSLFDSTFKLLQFLKSFIVDGVENRHELVPDLLELIPLFIQLEAVEEAEDLYQHVLSVSMGPSWYKEDQLGLMVNVLHEIPATDNVKKSLPQIAGYLERASGEMTFQRFIRYEKHDFLEELFRRGEYKSGFSYFQSQSCGTIEELLSKSEHGLIDRLSPMAGMRFPAGAIDDQAAILKIVRNAEEIDWKIRWALLEIFQFGDERHLEDFATEYATIINKITSNTSITNEISHRLEIVIGLEVSLEERKRFIESFSKTLDPNHINFFSPLFTKFLKDGSTHGKNESSTKVPPFKPSGTEDKNENNDSLYCPGIFGKTSATKEADKVLAKAEISLKKGNLITAKQLAVEALQILQEGGWSIWGNLSKSSSRAEAILQEGAEKASEVMHYYAPLLEAEKYEPYWRLAEHLITILAEILDQDQRSTLLQYVIDHIFIMIGNAKEDIKMFNFLGEDTSVPPSIEGFRFILWLLNHPKSLRREKAAGMVTWLVEKDSIYFNEGAKEAFSMESSFSADILCCVFDEMSLRHPGYLWNRFIKTLDFQEVVNTCKHSGRLTTLHHIATRAARAGLMSGIEVVSFIEKQFRPGKITITGIGKHFALPYWANCISREWEKLDKMDILCDSFVKDLEENLSKLCYPLDIPTCMDLEKAVSKSFRETPNIKLGRWGAKIHFALNTALLPYISKRNFHAVELITRVYNPSMPERIFETNAPVLVDTIENGNCSSGTIDGSDYYFLNYHGISHTGEKEIIVHTEVLAVVIPNSDNCQPPPFSIKNSFTSSERPDFLTETHSHETCYRLRPELTLFGPFTPPYPLQSFKDLTGAKESDFYRVTWKNSRTNDFRFNGLPLQEGCLLAILKKAVCLPDGKQLAWLIFENSKLITIIDSQNRTLV